ncbi:hypothetical protein BDK51DRAFT_34591 [Blyttiomyces helicus]|uniref:Uncharacterized protein n=1 Tax=Blyttiomyces helicus TaxID=388810 RepID=A0A4P9W660_9FUNG|nr:hypothetical protein BDK51DRAFT_34591 [Blyttiomyces helicus]|eukprot:RKO86835.1 hypothetical protein BDK51DRAFT_34591 [Blyttiomyces helicus]
MTVFSDEMSLLMFDKGVISQTYLNTTDPQGTDGAVLTVSRPLPTCPEGILDLDSDDDIYDFDSDNKVSDLKKEKYEAGEETPQLENNSAAAAVYDRGMRDEEEEGGTVQITFLPRMG